MNVGALVVLRALRRGCSQRSTTSALHRHTPSSVRFSPCRRRLRPRSNCHCYCNDSLGRGGRGFTSSSAIASAPAAAAGGGSWSSGSGARRSRGQKGSSSRSDNSSSSRGEWAGNTWTAAKSKAPKSMKRPQRTPTSQAAPQVPPKGKGKAANGKGGAKANKKKSTPLSPGGMDSRAALRHFARGVRLKNNLSQHLLPNPFILNAMIDAAGVEEGQTVLEVGPGTGNLTIEALKRNKAREIVAVEIDIEMVDCLNKRLKDHRDEEEEKMKKKDKAVARNVEPHQQEEEQQQHQESSRRTEVRVVHANALKMQPLPAFDIWLSNTPYHISTKLLERLIGLTIANTGTTVAKAARATPAAAAAYKRAVMMLQLDFAQKLVSVPRKRRYGALSVLSQCYTTMTLVREVKPGSFVPPPKVSSVIVRFVPRTDAILPPSEAKEFSAFLRTCFRSRHKKLRGVLGRRALFREDVPEGAWGMSPCEGEEGEEEEEEEEVQRYTSKHIQDGEHAQEEQLQKLMIQQLMGRDDAAQRGAGGRADKDEEEDADDDDDDDEEEEEGDGGGAKALVLEVLEELEVAGVRPSHLAPDDLAKLFKTLQSRGLAFRT